MKPLIFLSLFLPHLTGCTNDQGFNDNRLPESLKTLYREDAVQLTLDELLSKNGEQDVDLPSDLIDKYYKALVTVFNAETLPERTAVVETYEIHTFKRADPHSVLITVDPGYAWTVAWQNDQTTTGNPLIDDLLETYELSLADYQEFTNLAVLETPRTLNPFALAVMFEAIPGVLFSDANTFAGDGNNIFAVRNGNAFEITYSRGWGDCPSGCIFRHHWRFMVLNYATATFLDESGDPLP